MRAALAVRLPAGLRDVFGRRVLVVGHVTPRTPTLTVVRGNPHAPRAGARHPLPVASTRARGDVA